MDREQFDALARLVWTKSSRRTALGTILGAALLGHAPNSSAAKRKGKRKRRRKRKNRDCYPGTSCLPGQGQDNSGCDFTSSTQFFEGDFQGSNLSHTNLTGAQLAKGNFQGADLGGACLVGANLHEAVIDNSTNLKDAIFCQTLMPNGSLNDSGCEQGTRCCPTPCQGEACADPNCINTINHVCSIFGTRCCSHRLRSGANSGACSGSAPIPVVGFCEFACNTDSDCTEIFGTGVGCALNTFFCPLIGLCCQWQF